MTRLQDKVAIVIGAGQSPGPTIGNGRATALRFLQEGAAVMAVDRNADAARETVEMANDSARADGAYFAADVTDAKSLRAAVDETMRRWGRVDILHYNVGVNVLGNDQPLESLTEDIFDSVNAINLRGAIMAAQAVEPIMRAQRSGVVVNVSSMSAIETTTPYVTYRTSKAGMIAFSQQFAVRNAEYGIRCNAILPGRIETAVAVDARAERSGRSREEIASERAARIPLAGHTPTGWDIANAALFLASDEAAFITGVSLPVDGGSLVTIG
ncbi:SDR family NAD(P)-dependent oxidoreductase [Gordonia hydrophobica]|uniref:SDR family oxidoreductase n=1 Tax=Gordonia hydrophobica TaxID=40516 RepID=A0ABZ2U9A1_9ACTN|nr:SDR family oxidoreductase [Gordonia hydrophobica]MBM7365399.1 NAD(P)-dependent dehydrogenase (short-subunit alcohol dehydrogenase family) [Gordonia hydrophobica]